MSITSSLNIAQEAMSVSQAGITVTSNNIANVGTTGYSKLRADQASVVNVSNQAGRSAIIDAESLSGVSLASITRYSDSPLQSYCWDETSTASYWSQYSTTASSVENLVNEFNTTGLSTALSDFYTAASNLSKNASDKTARQNYVSKLDNVCTTFNNMSKNLTNIQTSLVGTASSNESSTIAVQVDKVNGILDKLANVNQSLMKTCKGGTPDSSLLDERDSLVTELTALIPVNTQESDSGAIDVSLGSYSLIDGGTLNGHLSVANSVVGGNIKTTVSIVDPDKPYITKQANVNSELTSGSIGAILDICGNGSGSFTINDVKTSLDTMASQFANVLNSIQTQVNYKSTGTPMCMNSSTLQLEVSSTTNYLLVNSSTSLSTGITAANIGVSSAVTSDPYLVAAARVTDTTDLKATGNNSNMALVTAARTDATYYSGLGGSTLEGYLTSTVTGVGSAVDNISANAKTEALSLKAIKTQLSSETGVNLDEELANLIKYQQAYQAAARIFTTCSDILDTLVNMGK